MFLLVDARETWYLDYLLLRSGYEAVLNLYKVS